MALRLFNNSAGVFSNKIKAGEIVDKQQIEYYQIYLLFVMYLSLVFGIPVGMLSVKQMPAEFFKNRLLHLTIMKTEV